MGRAINIYGGTDPRELPRYSAAEAASYLRVPRTTLRAWGRGRVDANGERTEALIRLPVGSALLSFQNLVEIHVLSAIRRHRGVSVQRVGQALRFVEKRMPARRPLLTARFRSEGIHLFTGKLGKLIRSSREDLAAIETALRAHLARVEYDPDGIASRLFTSVRAEREEVPAIEIDPLVSFGKPVVAKTGVPVSVIAGRFRAGEDVTAIAMDYQISVGTTHEAIRAAIPAVG